MNEATRAFISRHADDDPRALALTAARQGEVDLTAALQQIAGRQQARRKLPTWAATDGLLYPPHLNLEQCSSERTARYKATVAARLLDDLRRGLMPHAPAVPVHPTRLLDLTGGFGVDFAAMAPLFDEAVYVERDATLCQLVAHNLQVLGLGRATCRCVSDDSARYLASAAPATLIYLDPARRDLHGARTYGIGDCTPNVLELRTALLDKSGVLMLKLSPMLDWRKAVADLGAHEVSQVHVVSVGNECKELLLVMSRHACADAPTLYCVNDDDVFKVTPTDAVRSDVSTPRSGAFLYEPNASVMKAGCFGQLAARYGVSAVAANSHLFTSDAPVAHFPGRCFRIDAVSTLNRRELKRTLAHLRQANISVRNFPLTADALRRRLKLADGGTDYLFATTLADGSHVLLCCHKAAGPCPTPPQNQ